MQYQQFIQVVQINLNYVMNDVTKYIFGASVLMNIEKHIHRLELDPDDWFQRHYQNGVLRKHIVHISQFSD